MTRSEYRQYTASRWWMQRRKSYLSNHGECNRCGMSRPESLTYYDQDLHVHHNNYQHLGCERDEDLETLCRRCHEIETFGKTLLRRLGVNQRLLESLISVQAGPQLFRQSEPYMTSDGLAGVFA